MRARRAYLETTPSYAAKSPAKARHQPFLFRYTATFNTQHFLVCGFRTWGRHSIGRPLLEFRDFDKPHAPA